MTGGLGALLKAEKEKKAKAEADKKAKAEAKARAKKTFYYCFRIQMKKSLFGAKTIQWSFVQMKMNVDPISDAALKIKNSIIINPSGVFDSTTIVKTDFVNSLIKYEVNVKSSKVSETKPSAAASGLSLGA